MDRDANYMADILIFLGGRTWPETEMIASPRSSLRRKGFNMKPSHIVVLLLIVGAGLLGATTYSPMGRYQMVVEHGRIYKLDTATGYVTVHRERAGNIIEVAKDQIPQPRPPSDTKSADSYTWEDLVESWERMSQDNQHGEEKQ